MSLVDGDILLPEEAPNDNFIRSCELVKVVDGDTYRFEIDQGFGQKLTYDVRLSYVDTPAARGKESAAGRWVVDRVNEWIDGRTSFMLWSQKFELGKFGRCLCQVWLDGKNLNRWLLESRFAWPTDDNGKIIGPRDVSVLALPSEIIHQVQKGS